jgi:shikimate kinase
MGSGKSSVGRLVASKLNHRFVDTDRLVIKATGLTIAAIFEKHGEDYFREWETESLRSLLGQDGMVIATGGGIVTRPENRDLLQQLGFRVWLQADVETILERVSRTRKRPLLFTDNPRETIANLLAERTPFYSALANLTINTSSRSHEELAAMIIDEAKSYFLCDSPS